MLEKQEVVPILRPEAAGMRVGLASAEGVGAAALAAPSGTRVGQFSGGGGVQRVDVAVVP